MSTDRASDAAILAGIAATLREVVIPAIERDGRGADNFTRLAAVQMAGLAAYAANRSADPTAGRREELATALAVLRANEIVGQCVGTAADQDPMAVASAALVACVARTDAAANEVRSVLRPVLVAHLDDELLSTTPLMEAFRGRLSDA